MNRSSGDSSRSKGTRSVARTVQLLTEIAARNAKGMRLVDVTHSTGLDRSTAHRILQCLVEEEMLAQDEKRRYFLGAKTYELGLSASSRFNLRDVCAASIERIARKSGDIAFLTIRSGLDGVCLERKEGDFPIRAHTFEVGARRPLGIGAGGLAILSALPPNQIRAIVSANARRLRSHRGFTTAVLLQEVDRVQALGYVVREGSVLGARAIGMPLRNRFGVPFAALSISAISERMQQARHPELLKLLAAEVKLIQEKLNRSGTGR